jgi:acyl-CoA synthetase (AMP-forming)/AMP-acid ligase II
MKGAGRRAAHQVCALPLYHIFAFTYCMMLSMRMGGKLILIPNPRDLPAVLKELSKHRIHSFRRSTRCSTAWPTTPTSTPSTGAT